MSLWISKSMSLSIEMWEENLKVYYALSSHYVAWPEV